ncbi:MAG: NAD(P)-dependent oxidoreductase, partial [Nitrosarchaeum sp.]|nr:NAD(P)-dependent oxidoreductase [Nitrosarchaeum sp.]
QDICDIKITDKLFDNYDCIIHLAAITALPDCESNVRDTINVNVIGTTNIMECARKWNVPHVIFASTSAIYENNKEKIFTENLEVNPRLWYSLSKKMAEEVCKSYRINYSMNITTIRFFNVFGPRQDIHRKNPPLLNYLVREIKQGKQPVLHSTGEQARDYIHVDDVVKLIDLCLGKKPDDTFNVCTGSLLSVNQIVKYVCETFDSSIKPTYREALKLWDTYPNLFSGDYPLDKEIVAKETNKYSKGSYQKAKELLGWEPNTDLEFLIKKVATEINL